MLVVTATSDRARAEEPDTDGAVILLAGGFAGLLDRINSTGIREQSRQAALSDSVIVLQSIAVTWGVTNLDPLRGRETTPRLGGLCASSRGGRQRIPDRDFLRDPRS